MKTTENSETIKLKTIQFIMGTKYLNRDQVEQVCYIMCDKLGIEKSEDNFAHVKEACKIYFGLQASIS